MHNSILKQAIGLILCSALLLASFSVYAFAAKEPQNTNHSSATVSFGVQTAQFIESRTEITADGTQRQYGTLAFSFEVENASFEAHLPIILKSCRMAVRSMKPPRIGSAYRQSRTAMPPFWPHSRKLFPSGM